MMLLETLLALFCIGSCTYHNPVTSNEPSPYPGMVRIAAQNKSVVVGNNDSLAQLDEKPATQIKFTYDYYMDIVEVSIRHFQSLMGYIPREYDTIAVFDEQWPICYISWYEAVLYCNMRSKNEKLDTVYSYIAIEKTSTGEIVRLSGLQCEFSANGYRLPTEGEWIFAACGETEEEYVWGSDNVRKKAELYAWFAANAGSYPHAGALLLPNGHGLYDMAGNAAEWINESKTQLTGESITDYVGSNNTNLTLKIIKGGSYYQDLSALRIASRSDIYPVIAASRNRYAGFRCVVGRIANPGFITDDTSKLLLEPVSLVGHSILKTFTTTKAKLVFVNKTGQAAQTLCCIDYTSGQPVFREFTDNINVNHPTISPDGIWVAWGTNEEGSIGNGSISVRCLDRDNSAVVTLPDMPASIPRWFVNPSTNDTFLLYVTSAQMNDLATWKATQTRMYRFTGGVFSGDPVIVELGGAYHGGRSVDGTFLTTGYPRLKMKNTVTNENRTLFYAPFNGKKGEDTSQVCNVSISPSPVQTNQALFLDFGSGKEASTLTGTVYNAHEYLFIGDFTGTVTKWFRIPAPYDSWDHSEWSNNAHYAIATAKTGSGAHRAVFCINIEDSSYTPLCEGTDLYHPSLWIAPGVDTFTTDLDLDSVGQYDNPHLANSQALLAYKMRLFWHYADSLEIIFIGSSTAADGIDPRFFTNPKSFNWAVGFGDLATSVELIRNYVLNHCANIKIIGLSFDMNYFFIDKASIELYPTFTKSKGYQYDRNHGFWKDRLPANFSSFIDAVALPPCGPPPSSIDSLGLIRYGCSGWGTDPPPVLADTTGLAFNDIYEKNMRALFSTIKACSLSNVKVLLMTFPIHPGYGKTGAYGPMGPSNSAAHKMLDDAYAFAKENANLTVYDAYNFGDNDYTTSDFTDAGHLCTTGARKISVRVDSICIEMLKEK